MATVSFVQQPYKYNPINNPIWIVNYSLNYADPQFRYNFSLFKDDLYIGNSFSSLGLYKVPPRPNGYSNFDVHKILKANVDPNWSPEISDIMSPISTLNPAPVNSIIKFSYNYGYESYYGITLSSTFAYNIGGNDYVGITYSVPNSYPDYPITGDIVTIQMSGLSVNQQYNGQAIALSASTLGMITNISYGLTESNIGGLITLLQRTLGTSTFSYGINGVRQYYDKQINSAGYPYGYYDIYNDKNLVVPECTTTTTSTTTTTTTTLTTTTTTTTSTTTTTTTANYIAFTISPSYGLGFTTPFFGTPTMSEFSGFTLPSGTGNQTVNVTRTLSSGQTFTVTLYNDGSTPPFVRYLNLSVNNVPVDTITGATAGQTYVLTLPNNVSPNATILVSIDT
jgi:hypothetical protein